MKYKNAREMFPVWLLEALQNYAEGEIVYIPRKEDLKAGWGESNGTREKYIERNLEIIGCYHKGAAVSELSLRYNLTEYSIRKIIYLMKRKVTSC